MVERKVDVRVRPRSLFTRRLRRSRLRSDFHSRIASEAAGEIRGKWLVDVGCGPGLLERYLRQVAPSARLIGVDIDPWMLRVAKSEQAMEAVRATSIALPFKDCSVGTIVSSASLKDWSDRATGLKEIGRVLAQNGIGLVYDFATTGRGSSPKDFRNRYGLITDILRRAMSFFAPFSLEDAMTLTRDLGLPASVAMEPDLPVVRIAIRKDVAETEYA